MTMPLNTMKKNRGNDSGFTLVELMVVVAILGILSAIAVPIYMGQKDKAHGAVAASDVRNASLVLVEEMTEIVNFGSNPTVTFATNTSPTTMTINLAAGSGGFENGDTSRVLQVNFSSGTVPATGYVSSAAPNGGGKLSARITNENYWCITFYNNGQWVRNTSADGLEETNDPTSPIALNACSP